MNDEQKSDDEESRPQRSRLLTRRSEALGYDARTERRSLRRAAHRRKARTRLWLVTGPVVVVIAAIVALLVLFGGAGGQDATGGATTTTTIAPEVGSGLLVIEQDDTVPAVVMLYPRGGDGVVLTLPGITLLKSASSEFETLAELYAAGQGEALDAALSEALDVRVRSVASVKWSDLRSAMLDAGIDEVPAQTLESGSEGLEQVGRAVLALVAEGGSESGAPTWAQLALEGGAAAFREAVAADASVAATGEWTAIFLPGRLVEGADFTYIEPEVEKAKALLAGLAQEAAITVEVQNGSGVIGIAEQAAEALELLGYTVAASGNSEDFPDVKQTRIVVATDAVLAGEGVRAMLGVGTIVEDETLELGHVVVVVGSDFVPPTSADTSSGD